MRIASYALRPGDTLSAAARKIIGKQTARMRATIAGTREGNDPEALHDMRVATRRLRFALRLFAPWMPPGRAEHLRADLRRVALALGRVRDLDVLLGELPSLMDRAGLAEAERTAIAAALKRRRAQGRAVLVRMLSGNRFVGLVLILERAPMGPSPGDFARKEAHRMIRFAARKLHAFGRRADLNRPMDLHRLRILFKRLRYTCEYFNDLYGGAFDGAIARFIRFQDCLGKYQDAVVASGMLADLEKARNAKRETRNVNKYRDCPFFIEASDKLQAVLRERRGLQREAFSELWCEFPLILRAFDKLLRCVPPALPASPAADARPAQGG